MKQEAPAIIFDLAGAVHCDPGIESYQKRLESGCVVDQKIFDGAEQLAGYEVLIDVVVYIGIDGGDRFDGA